MDIKSKRHKTIDTICFYGFVFCASWLIISLPTRLLNNDVIEMVINTVLAIVIAVAFSDKVNVFVHKIFNLKE